MHIRTKHICSIVIRAFYFAAIALAMTADAAAQQALPPSTFTMTPSISGYSVIKVTVKRGGRALSGSLVPFLIDNDDVTIDLSEAYSQKSPRFHANVIFLSTSSKWLYTDECDTYLYTPGPREKCGGHTPKPIHFVQGLDGAVGEPLVVVIPEDRRARDFPAAQQYVMSHLSSFVAMSSSIAKAADQLTWFESFIAGLSSGAVDYSSGAARAKALAAQFTGNAAGVEKCYDAYPQSATNDDKAKLHNCLQKALTSSEAPPDFAAIPKDIGLAVGTLPLTILGGNIAPYIRLASDVANFFIQNSVTPYHYLPATLVPETIGPTDSMVRSLLATTVPPSYRSKGSKFSEVVFFRIGKGDATDDRPSIISDVTSTQQTQGICATQPTVSVPLKLDKTSPYLHDVNLVIQVSDGSVPARSIPLDARYMLSNPTLSVRPSSPDDQALDYATVGPHYASAYTVSLVGGYGFDPVARGAVPTATITVPQNAKWTFLTALPNAGRTATVSFRSPAAACLDQIEIYQGSAIPIATVKPTAVGPQRGSFTFDATTLRPGIPVDIHFVQLNPFGRNQIVDRTQKMLDASPSPAPDGGAVYLDDNMVYVQGANLDRAEVLTINGAHYTRDKTYSAVAACYENGPPIAPPTFALGQALSAFFQGAPPFTLSVKAVRPTVQSIDFVKVITTSTFAIRPAGLVLSNDIVQLHVLGTNLPSKPSLAIRGRPSTSRTPCDFMATDNQVVQNVELSGKTLLGSFRTTDIGSDTGPLQVAIVDADTKVTSTWTDLQGLTVTLAPDINSVTCTASSCALVGTHLATITDIGDDKGVSLLTADSCPKTMDPGKQCKTFSPASTIKLAIAGVAKPLTLNPASITRP